MSLEGHVVTLRAKHASLDRELDREQHRAMPDTVAVKKLKLEKLRIKEEIERISAN